jgi:acetyl esterase/lipase
MPDAIASRESPRWSAERFGATDASALVVVIHGGNWRAAVDATGTRPVSEALAAGGHHVWNLEYPRAAMPGGGWPGTALAVREGLAAAVREADGRPAVVVGHSAGGHLALWAAKGSGVAGVVCLAAVSDLTAAAGSDMRDDVAALLHADPAARPDILGQADPMARLPLGIPVVAVHGDDDPLVPLEQSRGYVAAAQASGDDAQLVTIPGADRADLRDPHSHAWPAVRDCVARLANS